MTSQLRIAIGECSNKGVKALNQDFHGKVLPKEPQLSLKGMAFAVADGISSSDVSQIASEKAVKGFMKDYYCTSEAWSSQLSGLRVIESINGWLSAHNQQLDIRFNKDRGYVCTFSAMVLKAATALLFHVGDSRVYRIQAKGVEQLTKDHRAYGSGQQSYLSRALGVNEKVEVDYQALPLTVGDCFILCTDGVYEHCDAPSILSILEDNSADLDHAAQLIVQHALNNGSQDNLTLQIVRVDELPQSHNSLLQQQIDSLDLPPLLKARDEFDGYTIQRELHANSRSHAYLAQDTQTKASVVLKIPSMSLRDDPAYLERFLMEEWVARRIDNAHVMKAGLQNRPRHFIYSVTEFIEGVTLKQWLIDNPKPDFATVRNMIEQIAIGLQAMHRMEILHQDLKPDNIMVDPSGTLKIIDFGGVRVAGIVESQRNLAQEDMQGTALYMAPEYFLGEPASNQSDQYSLAVIAYYMLSGRFPYGTHVAKATTISGQKRLLYQSVLDDERAIPAWADHTLRKALQVNPYKRYEELSEFIFELKQPNAKFLSQDRPPLIERNPLLFWKGLSLLLLGCVVGLLTYIQHLIH